MNQGKAGYSKADKCNSNRLFCRLFCLSGCIEDKIVEITSLDCVPSNSCINIITAVNSAIQRYGR